MPPLTILAKRSYTFVFLVGMGGLILNQTSLSRNASIVTSKRDLWQAAFSPDDKKKNETELPFARLSNTSLPLDVLSNTTRELEQPLKKQQQEVNQHQEHPQQQQPPICFPYNSREWLYAEGDRISNNAEGMDQAYVDQLMEPLLLQHVSKFTDQTICHPNGNFGTGSIPPATEWNASDINLVHAWRVKLIYLSIHALFHEPAYEEFRRRKQDNSSAMPSCPQVPLLDYECKDAKYVVSTIPDAGFGVSLRSGGIALIMTALASNRIPLFVNNARVGPKYIAEQWRLASCPRGDYQCVFHPMTPCTVRKSELQNATVLSESEQLPIRRDGRVAAKWDESKIWIVPTGVMNYRYFRSLDVIRNRLQTKAMELVSQYARATMSDLSQPRRRQLDVLMRAAQGIVADTRNDDARYVTLYPVKRPIVTVRI